MGQILCQFQVERAALKAQGGKHLFVPVQKLTLGNNRGAITGRNLEPALALICSCGNTEQLQGNYWANAEEKC